LLPRGQGGYAPAWSAEAEVQWTQENGLGPNAIIYGTLRNTSGRTLYNVDLTVRTESMERVRITGFPDQDYQLKSQEQKAIWQGVPPRYERAEDSQEKKRWLAANPGVESWSGMVVYTNRLTIQPGELQSFYFTGFSVSSLPVGSLVVAEHPAGEAAPRELAVRQLAPSGP
jgi:hypothetical protein